MIRSSLARILSTFLVACLAAIALSPRVLAQDTNPPEIVELRVGFNNMFKVGAWTPVEVTIRGGGTSSVTGQLNLIVPDGDGTRSRVVSKPQQLFPGQRTTILMYVKFGEMYGTMNAQFIVDENRKVINRTFDNDDHGDHLMLPMGLQTADTLMVSVGGPLGIEREQSTQNYNLARTMVARLDDLSQLPYQWFGYDGVDALVLFTSHSELYSKLVEGSPQIVALDEWVQRGGKLVLCAGGQAPVLLQAGGALVRFAPGVLDGSTTLQRTAALENYSGASTPIPRVGGDQVRMQVPKFKRETIRGVIDAQEGDIPLVVRTPHIFGDIVFAGVDLDQKQLLDWKGRDPFMRKLLGLPQQKESDQSLSVQAANYGISDLAGQLRGALDQFGIEPISFAQVALLIFVYILLIGPGDYFFVKKFLKRMEWTWATFPAIVALVSIGAYGLAYWTKGSDLRLNQAEIVDVDVDSGMVRGAAWLNVFSPRTKAYNLSIAPLSASQSASIHAAASAEVPDGQEAPSSVPTSDAELEDLQMLFSWMGNPSTTWGGMNSNRSQPSLFSGEYTFSQSLDSMYQVPIQVWSTKSFTARYSYKAPPLIAADLHMAAGQVPEGTIKSELPFVLKHAVVLSGNSAFQLNDLAPGDTRSLVPGQHRDLAFALKDATLVHDENAKGYVRKNSPFRAGNASVLETLQAMMFYNAVGGREYVQLLNGNQRFVDLSSLLNLDRAILMGMVEKPAAELIDGGKPLTAADDEHWKHWTYYRFVIPIKPATSGSRPTE